MMAELLSLISSMLVQAYRLKGVLQLLKEKLKEVKEYLSANLPLIIAGQKGLVEEADLLIPNMRGIMTARINH